MVPAQQDEVRAERLHGCASVPTSVQDLLLERRDVLGDDRIRVVAVRERLDDGPLEKLVQERGSVVAPGRRRLVVVELREDDDLALTGSGIEVRLDIVPGLRHAHVRRGSSGRSSGTTAPVRSG